jgi:hypothetical protein
LLLGLDGYACVSYSGLAYIDSKPTDQWLAEVLSERETIPGHSGGLAIHHDSSLRPAIGPALVRLRAAIERDFVCQPKAHKHEGLCVLCSGFFMGRREPKTRPFMHHYSHDGADDSRLVRNHLPRLWNWKGEMTLGHVGVDPGEAKRELLAALGSPGLDLDQDDLERLLVDCIRTVSKRGDGLVGADCMSIVISRNADLRVRVRFLPAPEKDSGQDAYTPWVVAPGMLTPRSGFYGLPPQMSAGGYIVEFSRLPPFGPWRGEAGMHGQPQKPYP